MWTRNYCSLFGQNSHCSSLNIPQIISDKMQLSFKYWIFSDQTGSQKSKRKTTATKGSMKRLSEGVGGVGEAILQKALFSFLDSKKVRTTCAGYSEVQSLVVLAYFSVSQPYEFWKSSINTTSQVKRREFDTYGKFGILSCCIKVQHSTKDCSFKSGIGK